MMLDKTKTLSSSNSHFYHINPRPRHHNLAFYKDILQKMAKLQKKQNGHVFLGLLKA